MRNKFLVPGLFRRVRTIVGVGLREEVTGALLRTVFHTTKGLMPYRMSAWCFTQSNNSDLPSPSNPGVLGELTSVLRLEHRIELFLVKFRPSTYRRLHDILESVGFDQWYCL